MPGCSFRCNDESQRKAKQDVFLRSSGNKSRFIGMLSTYLTEARITVIKCVEDADTQIAKSALDVARTGRRANVVADDTDVALLLHYHWNPTMADVTFTSSKSTFDIKVFMMNHSPFIKTYLLVLHAWSGCDTTSAIHSKGKLSLMKKIETSPRIRQLLDTLRDKNADQFEVGEAGIQLFFHQYGGNNTLSKLR